MLPKLLRMTVLSALVGGVVGAVVGGIAGRLRRSRPRGLGPSLAGSFLGVLLAGLLPIEANPASLIGGPYAGIWFLAMAVLFVPAGALAGAVLGIVVAGHPRSRLRGPRALPLFTVAAYLISAVVLTLTLSPPGIAIRTLQPQGPVSLVAEVRGLEPIPSHLALSADGKDLVTAAPQQVQVRPLPAGRPRLRLEGGEVAYPMAAGRLLTLNPSDASPAPRSLLVWDLARGRRLQAMPADLNTPAGLLAVDFSPDGRHLAVALGQGPPITVWDLATARRVRSLDSPERVQQLHWTSEGLLVGADAGFRVLSAQDGRVLHTLPLGAAGPSSPARPVLSLGPSALSGDRSTFAAPLPGQGIAVWRVGRPVAVD
ncbi:hypothetical protein KBY76_11460 [Synechococcus sp. GreenBA-s]|nr:hypothetical protein [Synechococcus sp. GreenBA-s]